MKEIKVKLTFTEEMNRNKIHGLWKAAGESPSEIYTSRTGIHPEKYG